MVLLEQYFRVLENVALSFSASLEIASVDHLVLQRLPEAFGDRVVVAATAPIDAGDHAVGMEHGAMVVTGILAATIALVDKAGLGLAISARHGKPSKTSADTTWRQVRSIISPRSQIANRTFFRAA